MLDFVVLLIAIVTGCFGPTRIRVPSLDPQSAGSTAIATYDADKDGAISAAELDSVPGLKSGMGVMDANKDRKLTAEEIAGRVRKYQEDRAGLLFVAATVTLDGKPLPAATVALTPEAFIGRGVKPATGTTNEGGYCAFQTSGMDAPGVQCGIFKIEVSAKDTAGQERLPAKYNTETTLGVEIGMGSHVLHQGIELRLSSR